MKTKTAIMEAISILENHRGYLRELDSSGFLLKNVFTHKSNQINTIQILLSNLLPKEKQQIIDARINNDSSIRNAEEAETYYNEKYKT